VESDATRMCELLIGLPDVIVLGVVDEPGLLVVQVESAGLLRECLGCREPGRVRARAKVTFVDLPCFGRPTRLVWHKHRLACHNTLCAMVSWTLEGTRIAAPRMLLTDRAGRWVTEQVGRHGRTVNEVATEVACDSQTVIAPATCGRPCSSGAG
jgi:transposase